MLDSSSSDQDKKPSCSVLLVEDNHLNQKVATLMLSRFGIVPDVAERGDQAVELVKNKAYDLVLMDLHMPGMDGVDAAARIREFLGDKAPPIVALTADVITKSREEVQDKGLDGYLTKPISSEQLKQVLEEHAGMDFS